MLKHARLRELLTYDPATGFFTWRIDGYRRHSHQRAGKKAGCLFNGRITIGIAGKRYLASRLAVFWMTGRWPRQQVDHRNCIQSDNRWSNLRLATPSQNVQNRRIEGGNRTGFKGVIFCKYTGRYRARIRVNYRVIHLGRFDTPQKAHAAYVSAAKKYHGEFARAR